MHVLQSTNIRRGYSVCELHAPSVAIAALSSRDARWQFQSADDAAGYGHAERNDVSARQ